MTILIHILSFVSMLLITLIVHELGHLVLARLHRTKTTGFQIGVGPSIITRYTGRTVIRLTPETKLLNPEAKPLQPGDLASVYVTGEPGEEGYAAAGVLPRNGAKLPREKWETVRRHNETHMQLTGRIREMNKELIVLADMSWSLRAIPTIAGVILPDDPSRRMPEAYNAMPWRRQASITLAGPAANIVLMVLALIMVAVFPITSVNDPTWTAIEVEPGGPAEQAGMLPGDRIVRIGNRIHPSIEEINMRATKAAQMGRILRIGIIRDRANINLRVKPDPETGRIGARLEPRELPGREYQMTPGAIGQRVWNMSASYAGALKKLAITLVGDSENRMEMVSGPVVGSYQTAQAVEYAGMRAWLIILATLNLAVAVFNLLPIPPLDGYRMVSEGVQALRKGKPANPKLERAMVVGGALLIFLTSLYLLLNDIIKLTG